MSLRALLTTSAVFTASAVLLPCTAMAQDGGTVLNSATIQNVSYQAVSDASIETAIETSVMSGEHDAALNQNYGEGVAQAFREAYAINVMSPLWTQTSAKDLIKAVSVMEKSDSVNLSLKQETAKAVEDRFDGFTAQQRAEGDMALSMIYIQIQNIRHAPNTQVSKMAPPRLAGLESHLFSAAQSGQTSDEDYTLNFSSF